MFPESAHTLYPLVVAAAAIVGFATVLGSGRSAGVPLGRLVLLQLGLVALAHLGGRLYLLVELGMPWRWADLAELGYRHPGAIAGVVAGILVLRPLVLPQTSFWLLGDCVAPAIAFASAVMRVGCFVVGCCLGTPSDLPWALRFPPGSRASRMHASLGWIDSPAVASLHVHPLQIYFLVLSVAVAAFLMWFARRKTYDGQILLLFLALHELGKAALEVLRQDPLGGAGLTSVQVASLVAGCVGLTAMLVAPSWSRRRMAVRELALPR